MKDNISSKNSSNSSALPNVPSISTGWDTQTDGHPKFGEGPKSASRKRKLKSQPKKFVHHNNICDSLMTSYSDYRLLKLRERIRQRQVDFVEGKCLFQKLIITGFSPSTTLKNSLHSKKQRICDFTQNYLRGAKLPKPELEAKNTDFDADSKTCAENFSGKKQSSTASRSPNSEDDGKDLQNPEEGAEEDHCQPQNRITDRQDIRSYFQRAVGEKAKQKQAVFNKIFKIKRDQKVI